MSACSAITRWLKCQGGKLTSEQLAEAIKGTLSDGRCTKRLAMGGNAQIWSRVKRLQLTLRQLQLQPGGDLAFVAEARASSGDGVGSPS